MQLNCLEESQVLEIGIQPVSYTHLLFLPSIIGKDDCMIFISYSGEIDQLCELAKILKNKGTSIIVISSLGDNRLKKYADVVLHISTREKL